jgi:hypothetical protein
VIKHDNTAFIQAVPIAIGLGFLGAFALVFLIYTRVFPTLALPEGDH